MIGRLLGRLRHHKFIRDVGLNAMATALVAVSVLVINTLVGRVYGPEALGIYNTALSIYIILSIISVLGVPNSILKKSAEVQDDREALNRVFSSGLVIGVSSSLVMVGSIYAFLKWGISKADSGIVDAFTLMVPAIGFASINRCCRAFFNGVRDIKTCSLIELTRWLGILIFVAGAVYAERPFESIFRGFLLVEFILSLVCLIRLRKHANPFSGFVAGDLGDHFKFGIKSVLGSSLLVVNDRLTVLILASLLSHREVGIFSFAFEVSKGLLAFTTVIQTNFNPIISKHTASGNLGALTNDIRRIQFVVSKLAGVIFVMAAGGYPVYIMMFMGDAGFYGSIGIFYILLVGVSFAIMYFWMGGMLTMAGYPGDSIPRNIIFLSCTVVFNVILIPFFGIYGAAFATSATYFVRIFTLKIFVARRLGISLH